LSSGWKPARRPTRRPRRKASSGPEFAFHRSVTDKQREKLRQILITRLTELYRSVHSDVREAMVRELVDQSEPRDEGDESQESLLRDLRLRLAEVDAERAQLMEQALRRLGSPDFGKCIDCGGEIGWKRLSAVPWALRCVEDQEAAEFDAKDHSPSL